MVQHFAPRLFRDYLGDWGVALGIAAAVMLCCWIAWEFLPRPGARPAEAVGTVRDMQRGWQPQSKYNLVRLPSTTVVVLLPDGGASQFDGDPRLFEHCRRGGPIRLTRLKTNSGLPKWALAEKPCG